MGLRSSSDFLFHRSRMLPRELRPTGAEHPLVITFVGLALEARVATRSNVFVVCHEKGCDIAPSLGAALTAGCRSIISFGLAGGLAPELRPGDLIVASTIVDGKIIRPTDACWSNRLCQALPSSNYVPIIGVDVPIVDLERKRELHATIGAAAVDNESHIMARFATENEMSFAALRVIIDPAHRFVPDAALVAVRSDGSIDFAAILKEISSKPLQTISLLRLSIDLLVAWSQLIRVRHLL